MKNICVFCGSSNGNNEVYQQAAEKLGELLFRRGMRLIYGGGNIGLMGVIADKMMTLGGEVVGVIPDFLMKAEIGRTELTELVIVNSMHERKQRMAELADAFVAMPGGFGTLEELAEILTWVQLELVRKPIALLNINGYYDLLLAQLDHMVKEGFLKPQNRSLLINIQEPQHVLDTLHSFSFGNHSIWNKLNKT